VTSRRRAFALGFLIGAATTVPAVFIALLVPVGEWVLPFVTPGALLLRPFTGVLATWPGAVNLLLAAVANGLVVGVLAAGIQVLLARRHRRHPSR
jgi:hypothetical protein